MGSEELSSALGIKWDSHAGMPKAQQKRTTVDEKALRNHGCFGGDLQGGAGLEVGL